MKPLESRVFWAIVSEPPNAKRSHIVCGVRTNLFVCLFESRTRAKDVLDTLPNADWFRYRIVKVRVNQVNDGSEHR